jgi:hypothetical protein
MLPQLCTCVALRDPRLLLAMYEKDSVGVCNMRSKISSLLSSVNTAVQPVLGKSATNPVSRKLTINLSTVLRCREIFP